MSDEVEQVLVHLGRKNVGVDSVSWQVVDGAFFLGLHSGGGFHFASFFPEVLGGCFAEFRGGAGGWRRSWLCCWWVD